jgi:3-methyladenine DNA glycosylase AlkD
MKGIIQKTINSLEKFKDLKRIEFNKKTCPTAMKGIGVTVPNLRIVFKELKQQIKPLPEIEKIKIAIELVDTDIHECQSLAYGLIGEDKKALESLTENDIDRLGKNLDNWGSVDSYGILVTGLAWRAGIINTSKIKQYLRSKDHWQRRIAVVSTISLNKKSYGGTGDTKRTLEICQLVVDDHQDMVVKALSWALRELTKVDRDSVIHFIKKNKGKLHKRVLREVNNKLKFGTKNKT